METILIMLIIDLGLMGRCMVQVTDMNRECSDMVVDTISQQITSNKVTIMVK